ncbi:MAG TPA: 4Fe-4S dicluster domain-containing protein [Candidatus Omnitrophica bacterium]|nr:4Fe-4S dicluster domain-containing protein [Candidatus Omnitrophota bacterium]
MILPTVVMFLAAASFSFFIWLVYKRFWVRIDPDLEKASGMLPGLNCGACGFSGCVNFAQALKEGEDAKCPVLDEQKMFEICRILGRRVSPDLKKRAVLFCVARRTDKKFYADYKGLPNCAAAGLSSCYQACTFGCFGFGDCASACPVSAIEVKEGLASVDIDKCIGCGLCVKSCPRGIIKMVSVAGDFLPFVGCSNTESAKRVKDVCGVGCIGCGACLKIGPEGGFKIADNLAQADFEIIKKYNRQDYEKAAEKCPAHTIKISVLEI